MMADPSGSPAPQPIDERASTIAIVAHDLRHPLQALHLIAERLRTRPESGPLVADDLDRLVGHMTRLVDDLHVAAETRSGQLNNRSGWLDLPTTIHDAVRMLQPLASTKSQTILALTPGWLPMVWSDRDRIVQILANLVGLAIATTPCGGQITLRADTHEGMAHVAVAGGDGNVPPADQGWGIATRLVVAQRGRIWQEDQPGHGRIWHLTLPLQDEQAASRKPAA